MNGNSKIERLIDAAKAAGRVHDIKVRMTLPPQASEDVGGESIGALCDDEAWQELDDNVDGTRHRVTMTNTSLFYAEMEAGCEVEIELRGESMPEVVVGPDWKVIE